MISCGVDDYVRGVRAGDRAVLARAITLVESRAPRHADKAQALLVALLPHTGAAHRVAISGVPGVGKSTFIEALGCHLTDVGHRVAVLAIDPSSAVTGGSILGDKTRMGRLAVDRNAFIRPSPTGGSLGGVARRTREAMLVCEAAGFDVVLVETVGVGQSETLAADIVDTFVVLMLPGAGDELQGIKRGILELADVLAINKADGDARDAARRARHAYMGALRLMRSTAPGWQTPVATTSALTGEGVADLWRQVEDHRRALEAAGELEVRRARQRLGWMWRTLEGRLMDALHTHPDVAAALPGLERDVRDGRMTPTLAAARLLDAFGH